MKLIVLQEQMEAIIVTIIHNGVFTVHSVRPEILLSTERGSHPIYITGLNGIDLDQFFIASLVKLQ